MNCAQCGNALSAEPPEFFFTDPAYIGMEFIDWCQHCRILHLASRAPAMFGGGGEVELLTLKRP
jgi:hypothetical protein